MNAEESVCVLDECDKQKDKRNSLLGCQLEDQRRISRPSFISTFWVFLVKVSAYPIFFLA